MEQNAFRYTLLFAVLALAFGFVFLLVRKQRRGEHWQFSVYLRLPNLIQALVQTSIYIYMSQFSPWVGNYAPLIFYQIIFAMLFDIWLSLLVRKNARIGFSTLPIVLSINLFMWFRPAYFYAQLLLVIFAICSKQFLVRESGGRVTHIFNPSGIVLAIGSVIVLIMGADRYLLLPEIIESYNSSRPFIFAFILIVGSISQYVGQVPTVSLGAVLTLFGASSLSVYFTGHPAMNHWIDPSVLVGITLLITDPATTPKGKRNQFIFGCLYGLGILACYGILSYFHLHGYFAKVLVVPILNLLVPFFDSSRKGLNHAQSVQPETRKWVPSLVYASVLGALIPFAMMPKEKSLLGNLGGEKWAQINRR